MLGSGGFAAGDLSFRGAEQCHNLFGRHRARRIELLAVATRADRVLGDRRKLGLVETELLERLVKLVILQPLFEPRDESRGPHCLAAGQPEEALAKLR